MGKTFSRIINQFIVCAAAGLLCLSPHFFVFADTTKSYDSGINTVVTEEQTPEHDFYRDGSGRDITAIDVEERDYSVSAPKRSIMAAGSTAVTMTTSEEGVNFLKSFEGCRLKAYKAVETEGYWTIGYGHYDKDVKSGMAITQAQADQMLKEDLVKYETYVNNFQNNNKLTLTQKQFDALVSFTYNLGGAWSVNTGSKEYTIHKYLIEAAGNYDADKIKEAFGLYVKSGGAVLNGLVTRRKAEAILFLGGPVGIYKTTADSLNVRSGPGTSYEKLSALVKDTRIAIYEIQGSWMNNPTGSWGRCSYGWVCLGYCEFESASTEIKNVSGGISLSWSADPDADSYEILRKTGKAEDAVVATVKSTSYLDKKVTSGTTYTYYVRSLVKEMDEASVAQITYYSVPKLKSVSNTASGAKFKWKKVTGATQYRIYRKTGNGKFQKLTDTAELTWVDATAKSGKTYTYTAAALGADGTLGAYNETGLSEVYIAAPTKLKTKNDTKGITVSWKAPSGAVKYRIFKKVSGKWSQLKDTKNTTYTDKKVTSGVKYCYRVQCIDSKGAATVSGYTTGSSLLYLKKTTVTLSKLTGGVKVKWKKTAGAAKYLVYRRTATGKWKKIATVSGAANVIYKDTKAAKGVKYYYRVRACKGSTYSVYSDEKSIKR